MDRCVRVQQFRWLVPVLGVLWCMSASMAAPPEKAELLPKLSFAAQSQLQSGAFEGIRRKEHQEQKSDPAAVEKEVARYTDELKASIANGTYKLAESNAADLQKKFGTTDYTKVMDKPEVAAFFTNVIEVGIRQRREALHNAKASYSMEDEFSCLLDVGGRCRATWKTTKKLWNGTLQEHPESDSGTMACNAKERVLVRPHLQEGFFWKGVSENPGAYLATIGTNLLRSGRTSPLFASATPNDIVAVEDRQNATGILGVVLRSDDGAGGSYYSEVDVTKGYSVVREEYYADGVLRHATANSDFRELSPGLWYPMKQILTSITKNDIKPEVKQMVREGKLRVGSEELRAAQNVKEWDRCEYEFKSVRPNSPVSDEDFNLTVPPGFRVTDWRKRSAEGRPLMYTLGAESGFEQNEAVRVIGEDSVKRMRVGRAADTDTGTVPAGPTPAAPLAQQEPEPSAPQCAGAYRWLIAAVVLVGTACVSAIMWKRRVGRQ